MIGLDVGFEEGSEAGSNTEDSSNELPYPLATDSEPRRSKDGSQLYNPNWDGGINNKTVKEYLAASIAVIIQNNNERKVEIGILL